ncbi:hypothetical protein L1987_61922 [Smallanthus sonchifolius]|uniref:Uncharacterized protein n=1 Tax=Smallanthus sonchifolius TaxID=185202 RepID=A0ACB9C901_9ASTR|nr:hypothetical protein L1987_61922 [Smallanthus sonchifolius]
MASNLSSSPGKKVEVSDDFLEILIELFKELLKLRITDVFFATTVDEILKERALSTFVERLSTMLNQIENRGEMKKQQQQQEDPKPQDDDDDDDVEKLPESSSSTVLEVVKKFLNLNLEEIKNPETSYLTVHEFVLSSSLNKDTLQQDRKTDQGMENPKESSEHNDMQEARDEDPPQDVENDMTESSTVTECVALNPDGMEQKLQNIFESWKDVSNRREDRYSLSVTGVSLMILEIALRVIDVSLMILDIALAITCVALMISVH